MHIPSGNAAVVTDKVRGLVETGWPMVFELSDNRARILFRSRSWRPERKDSMKLHVSGRMVFRKAKFSVSETVLQAVDNFALEKN